MTTRKRGRYIRARPAGGQFDDVAFDATLRAAAPYQKRRRAQRRKVAFAIRSEDVQRKVRVGRTSNLILFVVDASESMAVQPRIEAAKGAVLSLLTDAYQRRDRVGLIVFRGEEATLVLPPTNSVQLAHRALAEIPAGGNTPLAAGLDLSRRVVQQHRLLYPTVQPFVVIITDGLSNVSRTELTPEDDALQEARNLREAGASSVVINMEAPALDRGYAQRLADALGAPCLSIGELRAENLYEAVRLELEQP